MKKKWSIVLTALMGLCLAVGAAACNKDDNANNNPQNSSITSESVMPENSTSTHSHEWNKTHTQEATCELDGKVSFSCYCGETYDVKLDALGHVEQAHEGKAATCTEKGYYPYETCKRPNCDYTTYQEIDYDYDNHDILEHRARAATCTGFGWNAYEDCRRIGCDYTTYEKIPATGHSFEHGVCTAPDCGVQEPPENHVHEWDEGEVTTAPTCTSVGVHTYYCWCTDKKTELIDALEHDIQDVAAQAPTCVAVGWNAYKRCQRADCGYTTYQELPIAPNNHELISHESQQPTCTQVGWYAYETCERTDCGYTTYKEIPAKGHTYQKGECVVANCGAKQPLEEHLTHDWDEGQLTTEPDCVTEGVMTYTCWCKATKTEYTDPLGHTYVDGACSVCGEEDNSHKHVFGIKWKGDETNHWRECVCGERGEEGAHIWDNGTVTATATCGKDGVKTYVCDCGATKTETLPATGAHTYQADWTYSLNKHWKAATCGCNVKKDEGEHTPDSDNVCTTCLRTVGATEGVLYDISTDGTYAEVIGYEGEEIEVVIAATYNGLPVKKIYDDAFLENEFITSVIIPDSVTSIGDNAFYWCGSLTSVVIPDSVTSIGDCVFADCDSLTSVVIPDSVTSIGGSAFYSCNRLTSVVIGNGVTSIGDWVFRDCRSLTSVVIPDSVTSIGVNAFCYCTSLTSVTIPDSVTRIEEYVFVYCDRLTFNEYGNAKYLGNADNPYFALIEMKNTNYSSCTIHEKTKIIADYAFSGCTRLTEIVIPDSVTHIGHYAFSSWHEGYCTSLTSVVIGNGVTSMGEYAFSNCDSLTSVVIGDGVTSIGDGVFADCDSLTSVVIGNGVTSIGDSAFYSCDSLTSVVIPDSVTSIGAGAFSYCNGLTNVVIPDSITSIGSSPFYECCNLTSIEFKGTMAQWKAIGYYDWYSVPAEKVVCSDGEVAI